MDNLNSAPIPNLADMRGVQDITMEVNRFMWLCAACFMACAVLTGKSHAQAFLNKVEAIWLFDEGKGNAVEDSSGNGHEGEFRGDLQYVEGKFGTALEFGGPKEREWIEMDGPVPVNTVDFSFGCWIKPQRAQVCHASILSARDANNSEDGFEFDQLQCAHNRYRIVIGGVINWNEVGNPRNTVRPVSEEWNHIVFVRQGREGIWYLNGKPDRPKRGGFYVDLGSVRAVTPNKENFRIGAPIYDDGLCFHGILDEVFIFRRALSQLEVSTVMEKGIVGAQAVDAEGKIATVWGHLKS